jgi:hypothetical protein
MAALLNTVLQTFTYIQKMNFIFFDLCLGVRIFFIDAQWLKIQKGGGGAGGTVSLGF